MAKKNTKQVKKVTFKPKKSKQEATYKIGIVIVSKSYDYVLLYNDELLIKTGDPTVKSVIDLAKEHSIKIDDGDLILDENKHTTFKDNATFYITAIEMDRVKENKQLRWVSWDEALGLVSSKKALRETFELFKSLKKIPKDKVLSTFLNKLVPSKEDPKNDEPKEFEPESLEEKHKKGGNPKKETPTETPSEKDKYFTKNIILIFATLCIAIILIVLYFILSSNNEAIKKGMGVPVA